MNTNRAVLCLAAVCGATLPASAQAVRLATGPEPAVDGYLDVAPDQYGSWARPFEGGEGPNDDHFNPLGADTANAQVAFTSGFFYFSLRRRALLSANEEWRAVFPPDASVLLTTIQPNLGSDTNGDGVDDTASSSFSVVTGGVNLLFVLNQSVTSVVPGRVSAITQEYTITNLAPQLSFFTLVRTFDADLTWEGDSTDDEVGTSFNSATTGLSRFAFVQEAARPGATAVTVSVDGALRYFAGKQGVTPGLGGPPYGSGSDTVIWDAYDIPDSWRNHAAGLGYDTDGVSNTSPPGAADPADAFVGLDIDVFLQVGSSTTITVTHTYGASTPLGQSVGPLTRVQAAGALLDPGSGVPIDFTQAGLWSPFTDYGFGPGREGLMPAGTIVDPGNAAFDVDAEPGLVTAEPSYLFWINDGGPAGFEHPTRFAIVDATNPAPIEGDGIVTAPYLWWPMITRPAEDPESVFDRLAKRVTAEDRSTGNTDGLVGGPAPRPEDIVVVEPSLTEPPEGNRWALIVRGAAEDRYAADLTRFRNDLLDRYGVPVGHIITVGEVGEAAASTSDLTAAIDELCQAIDDAGEPCEKIYVRIMAHGSEGKLHLSDGHLTTTQFGDAMRDLAGKGAPVCLIMETCKSGSLLDPHDWDLPAGSSVITSADAAGSSWSDTWEDGNGDPLTGSLYPTAFSQCLNADPGDGADLNGDGEVDECEAHEWVVAQNPSWTWPGNDMDYGATRANPQKRTVGTSPSGLNVLVSNGTGEAKTGFCIVFRGDVTGGAQQAWRADADDNIAGQWAEDGESVSHDAATDTTTVSWQDVDDAVRPGEYIHFGYVRQGLKPIRQHWTPSGEPDGADGDRAPASESSMRPTSSEDEIVLRTAARSEANDGTDAPLSVEYSYRVAPAPLPLEHLNLAFLDAEGLPVQLLGDIALDPDAPQQFLVPASEVPEGAALIIESHITWDLNGNTAVQLVQFGDEQPVDACPADTNADGFVDVQDLVNVILAWDSGGQQPGIDADVNDDGTVDVSDLVEVILSWGACPA